MPVIKPISDLRNKANAISSLVHKLKEPVFITKNGEGDMVVMSLVLYGQLQLKLDLLSKLAIAQKERLSSGPRPTIKQVIGNIRRKLHGSS